MFRRQTSGSILCPSCGLLVGVNDEQCLNCGRRRPGLWGFTGPLALLRSEEGFVQFVMWTCGILYALTLLADPGGIDGLLSPGDVVERFGISGAIPVFVRDRWWTVLSAGWLHGSLLHIAFNLMAIRNLGPGMVHLYGSARTILIYVISCATGFLATNAFEESLEEARGSRLRIEHWRGFARRLGFQAASALDPLRFSCDSQSDSGAGSRGA